MASMVAANNGVVGISAGNLWQVQSNTGWTFTGGRSVVQVVVTKDQSGNQELFVRENNNDVWYEDNSLWYNTNGYLDSMVAGNNGIFGTNNGNLFQNTGSGGWSFTGGQGVVQTVVTKDRNGNQELFVRENNNDVWYEDNSLWYNTNGHLDSMVAGSNGIFGTTSGYLFQNTGSGGWSYTGGQNVAQVVVTKDFSGNQELFVRLNNNNIGYNDGSGWVNTNGYLDMMVAGNVGIFGTNSGYLFQNTGSGGWSYTGGQGVTQVVVSKDQNGNQELFVEKTNREIYYNDGAGWVDSIGYLD